MTECPNCRAPMRTHALAAHGTLGTIDIDACASCRVFWFDRTESIALAPKSILALFQLVGGGESLPRRPLDSALDCPRCSKPLVLTHDLQRSTRFVYWRCGWGHGRLTPFSQFLREKNFVREPSHVELERLRASVRQIACSQCGAPLDLARDAACSHCGSPIALIDPDGVAKALGELDAAARANAPALDAEALRGRLAEAQATAIIEAARTHVYDEDRNPDLLHAGAAALAALVAAWLGAR